MEVTTTDNTKDTKKRKHKFNLRHLRLSLKYRPEILKLVLKMRQCIKKKTLQLNKLKQEIKLQERLQINKKDLSSQTENIGIELKSLMTKEFIEKNVQTDEAVIYGLKSLMTKEFIEKNVQTDEAVIYGTLQIDKNSVTNEKLKDSITQTEFKLKTSVNKDLVEKDVQTKALHVADPSQTTKSLDTKVDLINSTTQTINKDLAEKLIQTEELNLANAMEVDKYIIAKEIKESTTQTAKVEINDMLEKVVQTDEAYLKSLIQVDEKRVTKVKDSSTQTDDMLTIDKDNTTNNILHKVDAHTDKPIDDDKEAAGWNISQPDEKGKSIAEQVKEAAQSAMQQSGMVYVESAGMYYDYKTGYYYNSELGLYYHSDTGCYYTYSDDKKEFAFHSYPDRSALAARAALDAHEKRKAKKHKKAWKTEEDVDNLTKNFSQDKEDEATKPKRKKKSDKKIHTKIVSKKRNKDKVVKSSTEKETAIVSDNKDKVEGLENEEKDGTAKAGSEEDVTEKHGSEKDATANARSDKDELEKGGSDIEDGECSETASEGEEESESDASTSTDSDDDTIAKHHPPCMRVIVRDTNLPKLKVGTLFLVTKDGGTVGREGEQHTILIRDSNISRTHLDIRYDMNRRMYMATDLGSKNGTLLNGVQMSGSQEVSKPMEVMHGSTIQLGETKLLCHIHAGNDTCGHCEPGLLMETQEKVKVAYTRTCNVQKQYQLELARLKNKYGPEPLMIEEGTYTDRAKARRETTGSSHHSEKTQTTDMETSIAPENKGFKLLEKMGWSKGEGLGKDRQGHTEPIPLVSNDGKAGLGTPGSVAAPVGNPLPKKRNNLGPATLRLATRTKMLQAPAKAFQNPLEEDSE